MASHGGNPCPLDDAIEMTAGILAGLEHLHRKRIIHRDLKPDNILLQGDTPRLADFGIARVLRTTSTTGASGTPLYMAPEAFDGKRSEQTDLWSVGVIFHQLLCGSFPFDGVEIASLLKAILTSDPSPLPLFVPEPVRDIVTTALRKDPKERYASASEMRQALRTARHSIGHEKPAPIQTLAAEPPSVPVPSPQPHTGQTMPSKEATTLPFIEPAWPNARLKTASAFVSGLSRKTKIALAAVSVVAIAVLAFFLFGRPGSTNATFMRQLAGHTGNVQAVAFSPNGKELITGGADASVNRWDVQSGALKGSLRGHTDAVTSVAFSPDGKSIVTASRDGTVRVWNADNGQVAQVLSEGSSPANVVTFQPKQRVVAVGSDDGVIRIWDIDSGVLKIRLAFRTKRPVFTLCFSPDGQMLASGGGGNEDTAAAGEIDIWSVRRWDFVNSLMGHVNAVNSLAFLPDNRTLISGGRDGDIRFWDVPTTKSNNTVSAHSGGVSALAVSPDGHTLISGGKDDALRVWAIDSTKASGFSPRTGNGGEVLAVGFSADGSTAATGSSDRLAKLWSF
jgi:WD40 repeat protein